MAGAMEEAATAALKNRQGEEREFQIEARLVMEECTALRDKIQPNIPVEVDVDANLLEMVVSFLDLRRSIRDQFPSDYKTAQEMKMQREPYPKKECIQQMEHNWVETTFHAKFSPTFAKLMMVAHDLGCESLSGVLAEWIVGNMTDMNPHEISGFFGIQCDHSEEYVQEHKEECDWAYSNVENTLKETQKRQMADADDNVDVVQGQGTAPGAEP